MPFPHVNLESRQKKRKAGQSRSEGLCEHRVLCGYSATFVKPEPLLGPAWAVAFRIPRPISGAAGPAGVGHSQVPPGTCCQPPGLLASTSQGGRQGLWSVATSFGENFLHPRLCSFPLTFLIGHM